MLAFTNTIETKEQALKAAKYHREADMLIRGTYGYGEGSSFKGCSVGCAYQPFKNQWLELDIHAISEPVHGIPEWLTRVRDTVFEGLPEDKSHNWHVDFVEAIPVGADLDKIKPQFMVCVLESCFGTFDHEKYPDVKRALEGSIALWKRDDIGSDDWNRTARAAGWAAEAARAAAWAAWAAARAAAAAGWAAWAAWAAEEAGAAEAARAAAEAARAAADAEARYEYFAKQLLEMMRNAPIGEVVYDQ